MKKKLDGFVNRIICVKMKVFSSIKGYVAIDFELILTTLGIVVHCTLIKEVVYVLMNK